MEGPTGCGIRLDVGLRVYHPLVATAGGVEAVKGFDGRVRPQRLLDFLIIDNGLVMDVIENSRRSLVLITEAAH